jgi:hypothetical protein
MSFFSGRLSFIKFRVRGRKPSMFGPDHMEKLAANASGKARIMAADATDVGWNAGDHILDTDFSLEKNIVNDSLQFALRIDRVKLPADLLRAYMDIELKALTASNAGALPSARQKKEARLAARDRLEREAKDGRFIQRKTYPMLWDCQSNELLAGTTGAAALDHLHGLFHKTFAHGFEPMFAGQRAYHLAETRNQTRGVDDARPTVFVPGEAAQAVAWVPDETSRDFLGNEFLLWLWFKVEVDDDVITLADDSKIAVMPARTLVLECPRGQTGRESIKSDAPTQLPEAHRAVQAGKLPRQLGLTVVRHEQQYEFTLHAETLGVTGLKLPAAEGDALQAIREERVGQLRHLLETLELLYDAFLQDRLGERWTKETARIRKWVERTKPPRFALRAVTEN